MGRRAAPGGNRVVVTGRGAPRPYSSSLCIHVMSRGEAAINNKRKTGSFSILVSLHLKSEVGFGGFACAVAMVMSLSVSISLSFSPCSFQGEGEGQLPLDATKAQVIKHPYREFGAEGTRHGRALHR
uniref:Homoserine kinase n=1 Tax=Anthurium amnicola TaxID=1678845 RepID=A0A1D1ZBW0_9ARAE